LISCFIFIILVQFNPATKLRRLFTYEKVTNMLLPKVAILAQFKCFRSDEHTKSSKSRRTSLGLAPLHRIALEIAFLIAP